MKTQILLLDAVIVLIMDDIYVRGLRVKMFRTEEGVVHLVRVDLSLDHSVPWLEPLSAAATSWRNAKVPVGLYTPFGQHYLFCQFSHPIC